MKREPWRGAVNRTDRWQRGLYCLHTPLVPIPIALLRLSVKRV